MIIAEHLVYQVEPVLAQHLIHRLAIIEASEKMAFHHLRAKVFLETPRLVVLAHKCVIVSHLCAVGHVRLRRCATDAKHESAGLGFLTGTEKHLSGDEFSEDTGHGPNIDAEVVITEA